VFLRASLSIHKEQADMNTLRPVRRALVPSLDRLESRELLSTAPASTGLHVVPSPTISRSILTATAAITPSDIWAVGFINLAPDPQKLLAEHWNGSSWSVVATPNPPGAGGSQFHGVAAAASNDVWAVGQTVSSDANGSPMWNPLIEHWNGKTWSVVTAASPAGGAVLNAVTVISPNNVWAVGSPGGGNGGSLIEHWDGTRWSIVAAPFTSNRGALLSVSGTSANDVWAVGRSFRHPGVEVLHFDGHTWSKVAAPSPFFDSVLTSVTAVAPNNVWAVGLTDVGPTRTLIEHWDGTAWSVVASPTPTAGMLFGVSAVSASDIWAVGTNANGQNLTEHFDGSTWSIIPSPNVGTGSNSLSAVTTLADGTVVAVGTATIPGSSFDNNGIILRR
jgi:hypothetical protein